jgi:hypothetical protein
VPATKTVTAQMMLLAMLSNALGGGDVDLGGLEPLPEAVQQALGKRSEAAQLGRHLARTTVGSVIGRGFAFPPALEIALKLKETSYVRAEPFSAADFLHGPVALVEANYSALLVDVGGRSAQAAAEIARAVRKRGGQPVLLRAAADAADASPMLGLQVGVSSHTRQSSRWCLVNCWPSSWRGRWDSTRPGRAGCRRSPARGDRVRSAIDRATQPRLADDRLDTLGILERINDEDQQVALAVRSALPRLAWAVDGRRTLRARWAGGAVRRGDFGATGDARRRAVADVRGATRALPGAHGGRGQRVSASDRRGRGRPGGGLRGG